MTVAGLSGEERTWEEVCVHRLFEAQVDRTPEAIAVAHGDLRVTYSELDTRANLIGRALMERGVGVGDRVGLGLGRSVDLVAGMLGILKAGAAYVPLDPEYPAHRISHMVEDSGVRVILTEKSLLARMTETGTDALVLDADPDPLAGVSTARPSPEIRGENQVYVIYTSGSTGKPKGTMVFHRGFGNLVNWYLEEFEFTADSRVLIVSSISFDLTQKNFFAPLAVGGILVVPESQVFDAGEIRRLIHEHGVTSINCTPTAFSGLVSEASPPELSKLSPLRWVFLGGEPIPMRRYQEWLERDDCTARIVNTYGPTECSDVVSWFTVEDYEDFLDNPVPIGSPIANTRLLVVDEGLSPRAVGEEGELCIGGDGVGGGYIGLEKQTAERFVRLDGAGEEGQVYRTGDLARITREGTVQFIGRMDNQVKIRGFRIELGEIEAVLESHPVIREAAVMPRDDAAGETRLAAYFVLSGAAPSISDLRAFLQQSLPDYMLPTAWVTLEAMPLLPNGKTDRKSLPNPFGKRPDLSVPFASPRSDAEKKVAEIWREMLGIDKVGTRDPFFEAGGTSIRAIEFVGRMARELGVSIPIVTFFEHPTIESFLGLLQRDFPKEFQETFGGTPDVRMTPKRKERRKREPQLTGDIAIVGMAGRFPGSGDVRQFYRNIRNGVESITDLTAEDLASEGLDPALLSAPGYVPRSAILEDYDRFDASFFGYLPREAELIEPQHRLFLELCWSALEDAGYDPYRFHGRIAVFGGVGRDIYLTRNIVGSPEHRAEMDQFSTTLGNEKDFPATRVAFKLNLKGPAVNVQTACSTSGVAAHLAIQNLRLGDSDMALVGGCRLMLPMRGGYWYREGGVTSPDGRCRAFDAAADGMIRGSGGGVLVLKRLEDALHDGDHVYALIKGTGVNNDGADKIGFTAPSVSGQADAIENAIASAGIDPTTVGYVETHGTGTALGDPIEVAGLTRAFQGFTGEKGFCGIGSVKSNIGHLDAGACVAGIIKTVFAMREGVLPPTLHFKEPNPKIDFQNSPFFVVGEALPWERKDGPRRAGVSSFGLGGTNAHVILEEAPVDAETVESNRPKLLLFSARTASALDAMKARFADAVESDSLLNLSDAAYTLQVGRARFRHRSAVVGVGRAEAIRALREPNPASSRTGTPLEPAGRVTYMFPGGGAQYLRMGKDLAGFNSTFTRSFEKGLESFRELTGIDLRGVLDPPPEREAWAREELERPSIQLPALYILEVALAEMWEDLGIVPEALLGHSLGENVAAHVAGIVSYEDGLGLVTLRGQLFEKLPGGGMLSVAASMEEVGRLLDLDSLDLSVGVVNAPGSLVLSGPTEGIGRAATILESTETEFQRIPISTAAHSVLLDEVLGDFRSYLESVELNPPKIPMLSNLSGRWLTDEEACDPEYWVRHLRGTVRFAECVAQLLTEPRVFLEVGPGKTLGSLVRMQDARAITVPSLRHQAEDVSDDEFAAMALGRLWVAGLEPNWSAFYRGEYRRRVPLPHYPYERQRHWIEPHPETGSMDIPEKTPSSYLPDSAEMVSKTNSIPASAPSRRENLMAEVKAVVSELSGLEPQEIDGELGFVEQGFDSLFLSQIAGGLRKRFELRFTVRNLMEQQSSVSHVVDRLDEELPLDRFQPTHEISDGPGAITGPGNSLQQLPGSSGLTPGGLEALMEEAVGQGDGLTKLERVIHQQLRTMQAQLDALARERTGEVAGPGSPEEPGAASSAATPSPGGTGEAREEGPQTTDAAPWQPVAAGQGDGELSEDQRQHILGLVERVNHRTPRSKEWVQKHRKLLSDPRTVQGFKALWKEMVYPVVSDRAQGSRIWDLDGNEYIDLVNGYGVTMFGHNPSFIMDAVREQLQKTIAIGPQTPLAGEVAALICELTGMERAAFCNTGSEAVLAAIRTARTVTGRERIATFSRHYHGIFDEVLVKSFSAGRVRKSVPQAPGIPRKAVEDVLVMDYGSPDAFDLLREHASEIALCLVEPIRSRNPDYQPFEYLRELRKVTEELDIPLLFDEMITGFRSHPGGIQSLAGVEADLATYGKVIGGGFPIGIVTGRGQFLDALDGGWWSFGDESRPEADMTWFAGTFVRHPAALAAARAVLTHLKDSGPALQEELSRTNESFVRRLNDLFRETGVPIWAERFASMFYLRFTEAVEFSPLLFHHLHIRGVYTYEGRPGYLTTAHTDEDIEQIVAAFRESIDELQSVGLLPGSVVNVDAGPKKVPLSAPQREVWIATRFGQEASAAFNVSFKLRVMGELDVEAMRDALQDLVDRHEALRTTFEEEGEFQYIHPSMDVPISIVDFTSAPGDEREEQATEFELSEVKRPFDLEAGPLVRVHLERLGEEEWRVLLLAHHIIVDGWSLGILSRDLGRIYSARVTGKAPRLNPVMQLSEYVGYLNSPEHLEDQRASEEYWVQEYATLPEPLSLPTDRPRPPVKTYAADRVSLFLEPHLVSELKEVARKQKTTLFAFGFAGFGAFLYRLTGQTDLVVTSDLAGQALLPGKDLVGHCVSFLPTRVSVDGSKPYGDLLADVRGKWLDTMEYQHYTYGSLLEHLNVPPDPSRLPLFSVSYNLDPSSLGVEFEGLEVVSDSIPRQFENNDLFVNLVQLDDGGIELQCTYNLDLFEEETVLRRMEEFLTLLKSAAEDPEQPIEELHLLPPAEKDLLDSWNETQAEYPLDSTLHGLIEARIQAAEDSVAIHAESGVQERLTYGELNRRADALAVRLQDLGVDRDTPVAVFMERSAELVVSLLAVLKSGGAYLPLDPGYPEARRAFMLDDSGARVILTQEELEGQLPANDREILVVDRIWEELTEGKPEDRAGPGDLAYVIYTSGSTGKPKGVMVEHRSIVNRLLWMEELLGLTGDDVFLQKTPFSFDVSVWEFFSPMLLSAPLVVARPEGHGDPRYLSSLIREEGVTTVHFVPSMLHAFLEGGDSGDWGSLRRVVCSGEALSPNLRDRFLEISEAALFNLYGPTEAAVDVSASRCREGDPGWTVPIGSPAANTQLHILDENGRPVPIGVPGELHIGGVQVGRGYLNRPELTEERFVPDPFGEDPGGRLYRTGDLCRFLPDGDIEFLGRLDHQVKLRGFRIELGEIEAVLEKVEGVSRAVVVLREVMPGEEALVGYLVGGADPEAVRERAAEALPEYMIPGFWVEMSELPLTPSGKVDRKALPAPERGTSSGPGEEAPLTETESRLAAFWKEVLGLPNCGPEDDFFALGGHSILATRVVNRVRREMGVEMPLRLMFQYPKLRDLGRVLDREYLHGASSADGREQEPETEILL